MTETATQRTRAVRALVGAEIRIEQLIGLRARAKDIAFDSLRSSRDTLSGAKRSRFRGRGMDYAESRIYAPGDDIRTMDWRVTARTGRAHTKIFQEERERPVLLLVDLGDTMRFGTRRAFKSVVAAEAAALLAWAVTGNGDRVGTLSFSARAHRESKPRGGRRGALQVAHAIASTAHATAELDPMSLGEALARARRVARPGTLVFILSDFYQLDEDAARHLARLHDHSDLFCLRVVDRIECVPPPGGRYAVSDGAARAVVDTRPGPARDRYAAFCRSLEETVQGRVTRAGARLGHLTCGEDIADRLRMILGTRSRRGSLAAAAPAEASSP